MTTYRLGGPRAMDRRRDETRDGDVVFVSPRGLSDASRFLIEALPKTPPSNALFGMDTEGAPLLAARQLWPEARFRWFHMDAYVASKVATVLDDNGVQDIAAEALSDPPNGPFDLVALPFPSRNERQLMWDLLESAHDALAMGGRLVASTDGDGRALRDAVKKVFRNVTPAGAGRKKGAAFYGIRKREGAALSDRRHVVHATVKSLDDDAGIPLRLETRPGTFAYRRFDDGTRALAEWLEPDPVTTILDLGAGCGALGIHAALRHPEARVTLVDSNVRAIDCARRNIELNEVSGRVEALVRTDLEDLPSGVDLVIANPPYFANLRIATSFVQKAFDALRPGGRLAIVVRAGKAAELHKEIITELFDDGEAEEIRGYAVLSTRRP